MVRSDPLQLCEQWCAVILCNYAVVGNALGESEKKRPKRRRWPSQNYAGAGWSQAPAAEFEPDSTT